MSTYAADQAATQFATINGDSIAYRKIGSGSPLLLANRMRGTLDTWDPLFLEGLAAAHTVITFDYPGVGYSSGKLPADMSDVAAIVVALAAELGLDKFAMGGWSWGGFVAQTMVVEHPELVTHAVIIGANPVGENALPIQQAFLDRALKPVNDLADEEVLFFEPKSARSMAAAKASHERIHARGGVTEKIPATMDEFMAFLGAARTAHADAKGRRAQLTQSTTPMLILGGSNDISTPSGNWYPLLGQIPRAQFIMLAESGHGPQHQYPELSAQYIRDFLRLAAK
jgi:pimeloyl-ACP methyl ester carboxylesterase